MRRHIFPALILSLAPLGAEALAHADSGLDLPQEGLTLDLGVSAAYRSESLVSSREVWVIPGQLMGGEALPSSKGISLDEAFLTPSFRKGSSYGFLKIGRHLGSEDLDMDHVLVGQEFAEGLAIELGRMAGAFTPFNGQHALETSFSSRRLVYDAFWGGQYNDDGVRLKASRYGFDFGIELWKGKSFPAKQLDTDRSAWDSYLRYGISGSRYSAQLGTYYYTAKADRRDDSRYAAGHSHGSSITLDPSYFDGSVSVRGLTLVSSVELGGVNRIGFQGEVSLSKQDGRIWDATHEARFASETTGLWGEVSFSHAHETLSLRSERLKIQNDIYGAGALVLAEKLSLDDTDKDPYRYTASFEHRFQPQFRSRIEWSKDFSTRDKKDIVTVGAVWSDALFESKTQIQED